MENHTEPNASLDDAIPNLDLHPGLLISNRYEILSLLGQGGMSVAFKALDRQLNREVTVKFLLPERVANVKDRLRFQREAMTAAQLQHPGIAKVFAFDFDEHSRPFLVMEFIEGQTLARRIECEGQLPIQETIEIFIRVTDALAFAHAHGVLHRDIKPSNIMLDSRDKAPASAVKLVDFGLAKLIESEDKAAWQITHTGELVGSPLYMSPEQARGAQLDNRSDLYSLGCTIYETLTGSPPHLGQTAVATILKHETDKPLTLGEASLGRSFPENLENLVAKLLAANPNDRYQSATDLLVDLRKTISASQTDIAGQTANIDKPRPTARNASSLAIWKLAIGLLLVTALPALGIAWFLTKQDRSHQIYDSPTGAFGVQPPGFEKVWLEAKFFIDKARTYKANGQYVEAIREYNNAVADYKQILLKVGSTDGPIRDLDMGDTLVEMADCFLMSGNYKEAKNCVEQSVVIGQNIGGRNRSIADALTATAAHFLQLPGTDTNEVFKIAQPLFDKSATMTAQIYGTKSIELAICLSKQADACLACGLLQEATSRCDKFIKYIGTRQAETWVQIVRVHAIAARVYSQSGDLKKLDFVTHELVYLYENSSLSDRKAMAPSLLITANALMKIAGNSNKERALVSRALYFYKTGLTDYEQSPEVGEITSRRKAEILLACYENLGRYYRQEGDAGRSSEYRLAELYYERALPLLKNYKETDPLAQHIHNELDYLTKVKGHR
jgi:serine/threonine protein kinase